MRLRVIRSCVIFTELAMASKTLGAWSSVFVLENIEAVYSETKSEILLTTPVSCVGEIWLDGLGDF